MAPTAGIVRERYGLSSTGALMGWLLLTHQVGGAIGTYLGGLVYEIAGGYAPAFVLMTIAAGIGATISLGIRGSSRAVAT
jgi:predicted MFS family arabinose efflux permease